MQTHVVIITTEKNAQLLICRLSEEQRIKEFQH